MHTRRMPGGDWSYATTSQGSTRSWNRAEANASPGLKMEHDPAGVLVADFWPPDLRENTCLCSKAPGLWQFVAAALGNQHSELAGSLAWSEGG